MNAAIDNSRWRTYGQAMEAGQPFIRLKLDIDEPVEIGEFVGSFLAISSQYDRFMQREHPKESGGARLFVREVRVGCIEADLVPWGLAAGGLLVGAVRLMSGANTVHEFVERWGGTLSWMGKKKGKRLEGAAKSDLQAIMQQLAPIVSVSGSKIEISAIRFENGAQNVSAFHVVTSSEAAVAVENAAEQKREMEQTTDADHNRVLMRFTRTDTKRGKVGKKAIEKAVIESISSKELAVIYASDLSEQRIRHEIVERESVYWKGFVVDVNVEYSQGKPVAYRVMHVHDVIELATDDE